MQATIGIYFAGHFTLAARAARNVNGKMNTFVIVQSSQIEKITIRTLAVLKHFRIKSVWDYRPIPGAAVEVPIATHQHVQPCIRLENTVIGRWMLVTDTTLDDKGGTLQRVRCIVLRTTPGDADDCVVTISDSCFQRAPHVAGE